MGAIENFQKSLSLPFGDILLQNWVFVLAGLVIVTFLIFNMVSSDGGDADMLLSDDADSGDGGGDGGGD